MAVAEFPGTTVEASGGCALTVSPTSTEETPAPQPPSINVSVKLEMESDDVMFMIFTTQLRPKWFHKTALKKGRSLRYAPLLNVYERVWSGPETQ